VSDAAVSPVVALTPGLDGSESGNAHPNASVTAGADQHAELNCHRAEVSALRL
jgi:hypothetical protein